MSQGSQLTISLDGLYSEDIRRIRLTVARALRNSEIRQRYSELLPRIGQLQAIMQIADEQRLSEDAVRSVLYRRK